MAWPQLQSNILKIRENSILKPTPQQENLIHSVFTARIVKFYKRKFAGMCSTRSGSTGIYSLSQDNVMVVTTRNGSRDASGMQDMMTICIKVMHALNQYNENVVESVVEGILARNRIFEQFMESGNKIEVVRKQSIQHAMYSSMCIVCNLRKPSREGELVGPMPLDLVVPSDGVWREYL
ncbi:unnamed protein product [Hermetia illucens]|uniref:Uncharacterized protein n=1 Tax=Hermetia illucens TaxID=343691 RepID=A0A7R8YSW6_HERIL|nr:unnamed protein product [Hermetia illucens]